MKQSFYLAGPMQRDFDKEWREDIKNFLLKHGYGYVNPYEKYGEARTQLVNWITLQKTTRRFDKMRNTLRDVILHPDITGVEDTTGTIAYVPKYTIGTAGEITHAYLNKKLVLIVTPLPLHSLSSWLILCSDYIFTNFESLKLFLKPQLIGLSGKAGSGKTTIAKDLVGQYGFQRYSFATKLKEICGEMYPDLIKKPKEEIRELYQNIGIGFREAKLPESKDVWVRYVLNQTAGLRRVVVDDVRFKNEMGALRNAGFQIIRIDRDKELRKNFGYNVDDPHSSETELDNADFDLVIQNDYKHPFPQATYTIAKHLQLIYIDAYKKIFFEKSDKKAMFTSLDSEWETPQKLFDLLDEEFHFTLDPCATKENAKCEYFFDKEFNGLIQDWIGNVFMNPPYGREIRHWVKKAYEESRFNANVVVCLLPSRTDTRWFHDYCILATEIRFIKGRLRFSGHKNSAPFPSMVVIFKRPPEIQIKELIVN